MVLYGHEFDRGTIKECLTRDNLEAIELFIDCDSRGVLPYAGGWLDQPANILEIFRALKSEQAKIQAERIKKNGDGNR